MAKYARLATSGNPWMSFRETEHMGYHKAADIADVKPVTVKNAGRATKCDEQRFIRASVSLGLEVATQPAVAGDLAFVLRVSAHRLNRDVTRRKFPFSPIN